jgi:signal transduction histidine kinase
MGEPKNKLFYQSDAGIGSAMEKRLKALADLGLLEAQTIPVFEEATQTAAQLLEMPICILGFLDRNRHWFKSAVGLSQLGLMNQLAQERQLPCSESFCTQVVESTQVLAISNTLSDSAYTNSLLVQRYGIHAYLGAPLIDSAGNCLGAIAVMDLQPRTFTSQQIKFLELMARWSMSEFERNQLLKLQAQGSRGTGENEDLYPTAQLLSSSTVSLPPLPLIPTGNPILPPIPEASSIIQVKLKLLEHLTQELRTPLTSVLGMANVVSREIYGPLTNKQKEYLEIIQDSGRYLLSLVNEVSQLGALHEGIEALNLTPVDIEMLCQQVLNSLEEVAKRREQQIRLSLEPGRSQIWVLDKEKVRQLVYHLVSSMIQAATTGSMIRIHISHKGEILNLTVSVSHPWLGEGLTPVDPQLSQLPMPDVSTSWEGEKLNSHLLPFASAVSLDSLSDKSELELVHSNNFNRSYESLRLLLSRELAELHGGQLSIQGTAESGYRYVVSLPELPAAKPNL